MRKFAVAVAALAIVGATLPGHAAAQTGVAGPGAIVSGFATPVIVASRSQPLTFVNLDPLQPHNIVSDLEGPGSRPWCSQFPKNHCPLFATETIDLGETSTADLVGTTAATVYTFTCTLHANTMKGTLVVAP